MTKFFRERLLQRCGHHYILVMMILTRLSGSVGGLLVVYYTELILRIPPEDETFFRVICLLFVCLALLTTTMFAMWETRHLRATLRRIKAGKRVPSDLADDATREAFVFAGRHHRFETWAVPCTSLVPILLVMHLTIGVSMTFVIAFSLAALMGTAMALMATYFAVEFFMQPVTRHLVDSGFTVDFDALPVASLRYRFGLCFALIIATTAMMIGTLAKQRASDIVADPMHQAEAVESLSKHSTYITVVAVITGIVYSTMLTGSVASRSKSLVEGMERVSRGKLDERLVPTGNDEIDILTRQFNSMVVLLDLDNRMIRDLNLNLEEKVQSRTKQLEETVATLKATEHQLTKYNQQLEAARSEAEAASRAKGDFLANISHELRTPLNGVIGMTDLLLETPLDSGQAKFAQAVKSSGVTLLRLLNDVLDFSRIESGKFELETIEFSLRETIRPLVEGAALGCRDEPVELAYFVDPAVPRRLRGDPGRLEQIISNLLSNAAKFTSQGSIIVRVSVVEETESTVVIRASVEDTGIGIPADRVDRLFEAFSQVDASTTRKYGGTGLGLSICKQLCELMQGEIDFHSREGVGSEFFCTLPFEKCESTLPSSQMPQPDCCERRILVIDDSMQTREVLLEQLRSWSFDATAVADPQTGLRRLREAVASGCPFDLVFIDRETCGFDAARFSKTLAEGREFSGTQCVLMLPLGDAFSPTEIRRMGYDHFVTKPTIPSSLLDVVMNAFGLVPVEGDAASAEVEQARSTIARTTHTGVEILLAEDNEINQDVATEILTRAGYGCTVASNGHEACQAVKTGRFHLVLMDCHMPIMDGLRATTMIRNRENTGAAGYDGRIPIVALTANAFSGDREKCLAAGMTDHLTKPLHPERFLSTIARCLADSELRTKPPETQHPVEPSSPAKPQQTGLLAPSLESKPTGSDHLLEAIEYESLLIRCVGNDDLAKKVLGKFHDSSQSAIDKLERAVKSNNAALLAIQAHTLKGSAANISANTVRDIANELEISGRDGNLEDAEAQLEALKREIEKLSGEIRKITGITSPEIKPDTQE